jgi:hypothetical protein
MIAALKLLMNPDGQALLSSVTSLITEARNGNEASDSEITRFLRSAKLAVDKYGPLVIGLSKAPVSADSAPMVRNALNSVGLDFGQEELAALLSLASKYSLRDEDVLSFIKGGNFTNFVRGLLSGTASTGGIVSSMCPCCGTHFFKEL